MSWGINLHQDCCEVVRREDDRVVLLGMTTSRRAAEFVALVDREEVLADPYAVEVEPLELRMVP